MTEQFASDAQAYIDGELPACKEESLFVALAEDAEARSYFRALQSLRNAGESERSRVPERLTKRIFEAIGADKRREVRTANPRRFRHAFVAAAALLVAIVSLWGWATTSANARALEWRHERAVETMEAQNEKIDALLNSLPTATVASQRENEIIIKPTM
jgi:anti-sigma factor RsiW